MVVMLEETVPNAKLVICGTEPESKALTYCGAKANSLGEPMYCNTCFGKPEPIVLVSPFSNSCPIKRTYTVATELPLSSRSKNHQTFPFIGTAALSATWMNRSETCTVGLV